MQQIYNKVCLKYYILDSNKLDEFINKNKWISDNEHNKPDKECAVLLQVTIIPITVNIEYASSVELAAEKAAKNVLQMLKIMLIHSLQYSNVANC